VADETRRQRRDARRAAESQSAPTTGRAVPQPAGAGDPPADVGSVTTTTVGGPRRLRFVNESIAELRKVEWPNRAQVIQGTVVVIIACGVVGLFLYLADLGLKPFVRDVLLNR
jgi:preprotein translocase SecE subunit